MTSSTRSTRSKSANNPPNGTRKKSSSAKSTGKVAKSTGSTTRRTSKHFQSRKAKNSTPDDLDFPDKDESGDETDEADDSDAYQEEDSEDEEGYESLDSDALDDEDFETKPKKKSLRKSESPLKRKRTNDTDSKSQKSAGSSPKRRKKSAEEDEEDEAESDNGGLEIVGEIVKAPTSGRVPPGQISCNTINFLQELKDPEKNDREWFKLHEPVYRQAEQEWKDFIEQFTKVLVEVDPQIPQLPPKDLIHRIYRDVRFSNDKTPYKKWFSATVSRSGKKGIFAGYHICLNPGDSFLAAGAWQPARNEIQTIRNNLLRSSSRLRNIISAPAFEKVFGEAKPKPKSMPKGKKANTQSLDSYSQRRNVFGREDELKVAPKGVAKDHKDIDLLKLRSFAVSARLEDDVVLAKDFKEKLREIFTVARPFVRCLNDLMTIPDLDEESGEE